MSKTSSKTSSRRQTREAIVQVLYSNGINNPVEYDPEALDLILESFRSKILLSRCKALLHLQQGRGKSLPSLGELVRQTLRPEHPEEETHPLRPIQDLAKAEQALQATLEALRLELNGNKNVERLHALLEDSQKSNHQSRTALAQLTTPRPSLPVVESARTMALELTSDLPRYSERLLYCLSEDPPDLPELSALRKTQSAMGTQREEITTVLTTMSRSLSQIDGAIEECVDNYTPQRIDRVDRAILRLSTYELLFRSELSPAVIINEAIEIARAFGSSDSPRFVNGVLDRVQKLRPASPSQTSDNL